MCETKDHFLSFKYNFVLNYYEQSVTVHPLGEVDESTPFQLVHF